MLRKFLGSRVIDFVDLVERPYRETQNVQCWDSLLSTQPTKGSLPANRLSSQSASIGFHGFKVWKPSGMTTFWNVILEKAPNPDEPEPNKTLIEHGKNGFNG